jgi:hypothetical protein
LRNTLVKSRRPALSFLQRTITDRWHFVKTVLNHETSMIVSIVFIGILSNWLKSFIGNSVDQATEEKPQWPNKRPYNGALGSATSMPR